MKEWYAVQTKPRREFYASSALESVAGVQTFLPVLQVKPVNPRSRTTLPFFPGYLFVCADLDQVGLSALCWTPGVAQVASYGGKPVAIPNRVIDEIRRRVDVVQQEDPFGLGRFQHGDRVRVKSGPLEGYEGMFDTRIGSQMRVRILVEFLGRLTATELDVRTIEKVSMYAVQL